MVLGGDVLTVFSLAWNISPSGTLVNTMNKISGVDTMSYIFTLAFFAPGARIINVNKQLVVELFVIGVSCFYTSHGQSTLCTNQHHLALSR